MGRSRESMAGGAEEGNLVAVIGDHDTCAGMLLAGIGDIERGKGSNYMKADGNTEIPQIEEKFHELTHRDDIAIVVLNQWIAEKIEGVISNYNQLIPTVVLVPSKDKPYDPSSDPVYNRILRMMGKG